MKHEYMI